MEKKPKSAKKYAVKGAIMAGAPTALLIITGAAEELGGQVPIVAIPVAIAAGAGAGLAYKKLKKVV